MTKPRSQTTGAHSSSVLGNAASQIRISTSSPEKAAAPSTARSIRSGSWLAPVRQSRSYSVSDGACGSCARGGARLDHARLSAISLIPPYSGFFPVQQVRQHRRVRHIRRRGPRGVDDLGLAVHSHMGPHSEAPWIAFLGLVHLRIGCCSRFLVDMGACRMVASMIVPLVMRTPRACKCRIYRAQDRLAKLMFFHPMAKLSNCGFVGPWLLSEIDGYELPRHRRVIQRLFDYRVRQVEPLLQKINPQHPAPLPPAAAHSPAGVESQRSEMHFGAVRFS